MVIRPEEWEDFPEEIEGSSRFRKAGRKKPKSLSLANKQDRRKKEKEKRAENFAEARKEIKDHLVRFIHSIPKGERRERQVADYIEWVEKSLEESIPFLDEEGVSIEEKGKIGGLTVEARHLPTMIKVVAGQDWQNRTSLDQRKKQARSELYIGVGKHFSFWEKMKKNSSGKLDVTETVDGILKEVERERLWQGKAA